MSNSTTTCLTDPPPSLLSNITTCQSSGTTPFCWPPNGTRICVPAPSGIPFYWPPSYYPVSSRVLIEWDLSSNIFPVRDNTGNRTQSITKYMYEQFGLGIPGAPENERSLKLYMRSNVEGGDLVNHEGPTVVLVKTADWTSASSRPTGTRTPSSYKDEDDDRDPLSGLTTGGMAGVIIGIIVGVVALVTLCCCCGCCGCCGKKTRSARRQERVKMDEEEQAKIVARGVELMEQKGGGAGGTRAATLDPGRGTREDEIGVARTTAGDGHGDEIRRVDMDTGREREEPPPKYTP